jgi:PAS domain S-box-containing protein
MSGETTIQAQLAAFLEATQAVSSSLELEQVLQAIIREAARVSGSPVVRLFLLDEDTRILRCCIGVGLPLEAERDLAIPVGESFSGQVAATGAPVAVADCRKDPRLRYPEHATKHGLVSYLGIPVKAHDHLFGVLVFNTSAPREYAADEVAYLSAFAQQAALAIQNARLYQQEQERRQQLEAVRAIGEEITRELDLNTLLRLIHERATALVGAVAGAVFLWDEADQVLVPRAWSGLGEWVAQVRLRPGEGLAGTVAQGREGMIDNAYRVSPYASPILLERTRVTAVLAEPLLYRGRLIGVITVHHEEPGRHFTQANQTLIRLFATQSAIAIENARLYQAAQLELTERQQIEAKLRESEQRYRNIVETAAEGIWVVDADWQTTFVNSRMTEMLGYSREEMLGRTPFPFMEESQAAVEEAMAQARQSVMHTAEAWLRRRDGRALYVLVNSSPIFDAAGQLVGFFAMLTDLTPRKQAEEVLLKRTQQLEAVRAVSAEITRELQLTALLDLITRRAGELAGAGSSTVWLWEETDQVLLSAAWYGLGDWMKGRRLRLGEGVSGVVAQRRQGLIVNDYRTSPYTQGPVLEHTGITAMLAEPLLYRGRLLGVIRVADDKTGRHFTEEDRRLLQHFAAQAAIAIENARLHETAAGRARQLATLNDLAHTMTTVLDPQGVAKEILAAIQVLVPGAAGRLWEQVGSPDELHLVAGVGLRDPEGGDTRVVHPQEGLLGTAIATRQPVISRDVSRDARFLDKDWAVAEGLVSCMILPLVLGEHVHGVLAIYTRADHTFTEEEIDLFKSFATQAAIAIENARLFHGEQARRRQVEAVRIVSEEIARELDLSRVLALIIRRSIELVGADSGIVRLWDESQGLLIPHSHVGMDPSRLFRLRLGEGVAGIVAERREGMIVNDFQTSAAVPQHIRKGSVVYATIAQPLLYRDRLVGVISIFRETPGRTFREEDQELLGVFATQSAIAIENARLYAATERGAHEARSLYEVAHSLTTSLELGEVLYLIAVKTTELLGTPHAQVVLWDEASQTLRFGAAHGTEADKARHQQYRLGEGLNGIVAQTRAPLVVNDYQAFPHRVPGLTEVTADMGVPLLYRGRFLGVLNAHSTQPGWVFTEAHLALLTSFADQAAVAIENARLFDAVQRHAAELEDRVKQRTVELEEALRVKAQFLANMSHELRTPLNFVIGFSELLREGTAGPLSLKQASYLERIHTGGKRLLELVTHLLEIAETDSQPTSFQLDRLVLTEVLDEVLAPLAAIAQAKSVALEMAPHPGLPFVVADRRKFTQIVHHLVTNAIRFTPTGGRVTVSARRVGTSKGEDAEIAVQDSGIGVRSEDLERIFLPFEQADGSDTRRYGGAGLGLALARQLTGLHGGRIWAESEGEGRGARFIVRLPLLPAPPPPQILVVEDEVFVREALRATLMAEGYGVDGVCSGIEAQERLAAGLPSLLILDIGLPDVDGRDLLKQLRADARTRDLPILILTGMESIRPEEILGLGADEFLTKPVSAQVVSATVARLLRRPGRERDGEGTGVSASTQDGTGSRA